MSTNQRQDDDDEAALRAAHRTLYRGMLDRDTDLLDELLDPDCTLTHMTGYVQSRAEWLDEIRSGGMRYHSAQQESCLVTVADERGVAVGRDLVDATIWGSRGRWRLQLTTQYRKREGQWLALHTQATTF